MRAITYDDAGRISSITRPEGTTSYTYDDNSNILTVIDAAGTITREYDALNRVTEYTDVNGNVIQYTYDAAGNQTSVIYPDGKTVQYAYDADNRLTTVTDWASRVTSYTYDANSNVLTVTRPDGSVLTNTYDADGRLATSNDLSSSNTVINSYAYTYDANGNMTAENTAAMTYDTLNRVTAKNDTPSSYAYTYDGSGNITSSTVNGNTVGMTYDTSNRLTTYNNQSISYDADGNMISAPLGGTATSFTYDSGNRLLTAGGTSYAYDAENNRITQTVNGVTTQYVYDSASSLSRMLVSTDTNGNVTYYVYGLGLLGAQDQSNYSIYHYDYRGSTTAITDATGAVTDTYAYGVYGIVESHSGTSTTPFLYNGRDGVVIDSNGLEYMRARYYSPELMRFVNADTYKGTITNSPSLNNYAYANGNPISLVDPFGMSADSSMGQLYMWEWEGFRDYYKNQWDSFVDNLTHPFRNFYQKLFASTMIGQIYNAGINSALYSVEAYQVWKYGDQESQARFSGDVVARIIEFDAQLAAGEVIGRIGGGIGEGASKFAEGAGSSTTRVGRWMSEAEYSKMVDTGKVQMSPNGNTTYVANPANPNAFKAAPNGSIYVEFDVPTGSINPAGNANWGQISGPGSLMDRLNQSKGLPPINGMPDATNITIPGR